MITCVKLDLSLYPGIKAQTHTYATRTPSTKFEEKSGDISVELSEETSAEVLELNPNSGNSMKLAESDTVGFNQSSLIFIL